MQNSQLDPLDSKIEQADPGTLMETMAELIHRRRQLKKRNPLDWFEYKNPKQLDFSKSVARTRVFYGGNRAGKSEIGSVETVRAAEGKHPFRAVPKNGIHWVISLDFNVQRDVLQPKFQRWLSPHRVAEITYRLHHVWDRVVLTCGRCFVPPTRRRGEGGSAIDEWKCPTCGGDAPMIVFKSVDQGRQKFQGAGIDTAWFDEEPPEDVFNEVRMRLIDRKGSMWLTFTPLMGQTWSYDRLYMRWKEGKDQDIHVVESSTFENSAIDEEEKAKLERDITDPAEREMRLFGRYAILTGLIYGHWDPKLNEVEEVPAQFMAQDGTIDPSFETYCGIDTGRCFAATFWLVDYFANVWGFDEWYSEDQSIQTNSRSLLAICRRWGIWPTFIIDPRTQQDLDLHEEGVPVVKARDMEVYDGIQIVRKYVNARRVHEEMIAAAKAAGRTDVLTEATPSDHPRLVVVAPNMRRFLFERGRYQWARPTQTGPAAGAPRAIPVKKNDHALDSARYVLQEKPLPSEMQLGNPNDRVISRHIERVKERQRLRQEMHEGYAQGDDYDYIGGHDE